MAIKRLGQILLDLGLIDEQQLETILEEIYDAFEGRRTQLVEARG